MATVILTTIWIKYSSKIRQTLLLKIQLLAKFSQLPTTKINRNFGAGFREEDPRVLHHLDEQMGLHKLRTRKAYPALRHSINQIPLRQREKKQGILWSERYGVRIPDGITRQLLYSSCQACVIINSEHFQHYDSYLFKMLCLLMILQQSVSKDI